MKRIKIVLLILLINIFPIILNAQEEPIPPFQKVKGIAITKGTTSKDGASYYYLKNVGGAEYFFGYTFSGASSGMIYLSKKVLSTRTLLYYSPGFGYTMMKGDAKDKKPTTTETIDKMAIWDIAVEWLRECDEY
jgi:hypothetical protein